MKSEVEFIESDHVQLNDLNCLLSEIKTLKEENQALKEFIKNVMDEMKTFI